MSGLVLIISIVLVFSGLVILLMPSRRKIPANYLPPEQGSPSSLQQRRSVGGVPNKRVCAFLIDLIILGIIEVLISVCGNFAGLVVPETVFTVFGAVYLLFKDCFGGKSFGKRMVGLEVTMNDGRSVSIQACMLRNIPFSLGSLGALFVGEAQVGSVWLFLLLPLLIDIVEYIFMSRSKDGRRIGDYIAGTVVVDLHPERTDGAFMFYSLIALVLCFASMFASASMRKGSSQEVYTHPQVGFSFSVLPGWQVVEEYPKGVVLAFAPDEKFPDSKKKLSIAFDDRWRQYSVEEAVESTKQDRVLKGYILLNEMPIHAKNTGKTIVTSYYDEWENYLVDMIFKDEQEAMYFVMSDIPEELVDGKDDGALMLLLDSFQFPSATYNQ